MSRTRRQPVSKNLSVILNAADTIIGNHDRDDGFTAARRGIEMHVDDPVERDYKLQLAGIDAQPVAAYLIARGGRRLIEGDPAGWVDVQNGCLAQYLRLKTALDLKARNADHPVQLQDAGFGLTTAMFCAGAAVLFPNAVDRGDVLRWCQVDPDGFKDDFRGNAWPEIETQFRLAVVALRLAEESDFEGGVNAAMSGVSGRSFDLRTYIGPAIEKHTQLAAEGLRRKHIEFIGMPAYCIFPAHLIAIARKLGDPTIGASEAPAQLSTAHLAAFPAETMSLDPLLDRLKNAIRQSGLFL